MASPSKAWSELAGSLFVTLYKNQCYLQCDSGCNFCTDYPIDLWMCELFEDDDVNPFGNRRLSMTAKGEYAAVLQLWTAVEFNPVAENGCAPPSVAWT